MKSKSNHSPPKIQDFRISSINIIQWNGQGNTNKKSDLEDLISNGKPDVLCIMQGNRQGITNKKLDLEDLISKEKPGVLCMQETMLSNRQISI